MSNLIPDLPPETGIIAWMARNTVAANLLLILVFLCGAYGLLNVKKEIFPTFPADTLTITIPYPGSSPEEVEDGVIIKVEEAIQDIEGIKEIRSTANEGSGVVTVEVEAGLDVTNVLNKIKVRVDGISSFPTQTETPIIDEVTRRVRVLDLSIHGALDEHELKHLADDVRDDLLAMPQITQITVEGVRDYEIAIEVSDTALQQYQLSFDEVIEAIRNQSKDIPGGKLRTDSRTITLRSLSQARTQAEYEQLPLLTGKDGTQVTVGDVATVKDTFSETPLLNRLNGEPAVTLQVNRVGRQSALEISDAVKAYTLKKQASLPEGVHLEVWSDRTNILKGRINLLLKNALQGMILVIITLALFLNLSLAFWVVVGLPFSFLGAFMLMSTSQLDYSINVISLFGFILVLGILVDDAIVTAESAYAMLEEEGKGIESIIRGVKRVSVATIFGVLTTIIAFAPMLFLTEGMAQLFSVVGAVVIMCLVFSIVESKLILPAHLGHLKVNQPSKFFILRLFENLQNKFSGAMHHFIHNRYAPFLTFTLQHRYSALAVFLVILMVCYTLLPSGILRFVFFPRIPSDFINVQMQMPQGTAHEITSRYALQFEEAALKINEDYKKQNHSEEGLIKQLETQVNGDTTANIKAELIPSTDRSITSVEIAQRWRHAIGDIPGVRSLRVDASAGRSSSPIDIELKGGDLDTLRLAAEEVKKTLRTFDGVYDIRDTFDSGGPEVNITLTPEGQSLGLGHAELARQIRQAFFGAEIQRIQRGRHEVRIYTRLPLAERDSLQALRDLWIRLPNGQNVPFSVVGKISEQSGVSVINRKNRERVVEVLADLDKTKVEPNRVVSVLTNETLKDIGEKYPSISFYFGGEAEEQASSTKTLGFSGIIMLMLIYAALAIPLRSYLKPLAIMSVLPFGVVGAFLGHVLLGIELNILSIVGIIALMGILVNDSLVLVDYMNQAAARGRAWREAIQEAGVKRFRAVFLTSITTFLGLLPIQMESSIQAQFLKPMAISVSFGVLFATLMTLLLIPVLLLIADDVKVFLFKNND